MIEVTKSKRRKTRQMVRALAGGHKSIPITIVAGDEFPNKYGEPGRVELIGVRWVGPGSYIPKCKYHHSTLGVNVGVEFLNQLENLDYRSTGEHYVKIDDVKYKVPNDKVGMFIIKSLPKQQFIYKDVRLI